MTGPLHHRMQQYLTTLGKTSPLAQQSPIYVYVVKCGFNFTFLNNYQPYTQHFSAKSILMHSVEIMPYHILNSHVYLYVSMHVSHLVMSNSLQHHGLQPTRLLCPWNSPGKNTGVGCHSLLQGIVLTQGLSLGSPSCMFLNSY